MTETIADVKQFSSEQLSLFKGLFSSSLNFFFVNSVNAEYKLHREQTALWLHLNLLAFSSWWLSPFVVLYFCCERVSNVLLGRVESFKAMACWVFSLSYGCCYWIISDIFHWKFDRSPDRAWRRTKTLNSQNFLVCDHMISLSSSINSIRISPSFSWRKCGLLGLLSCNNNEQSRLSGWSWTQPKIFTRHLVSCGPINLLRDPEFIVDTTEVGFPLIFCIWFPFSFNFL